MSVAEIALLITTLSGALVALFGVRNNSAKIGELENKLEQAHEEIIDAQDKQQDARKDIIQIGEQLHYARLDNAVIAEAFNQLFVEFQMVTGHRPAVNLDRLRHMQTIQYITGPLESGPLHIKEWMEPKPFLAHDTIRVLYANDAACALFCCEPLVLTARSVADLIVGEDFGTLARIHMQILREKGESPAIEYPFFRCDASVFWAMTESYKYDEHVFTMTLKKTFEEW